MKKGYVFLLLFYLMPLLLLALVAWQLFFFNYHEFSAYLAASLQKTDWEKFIQQRFTARAFGAARWAITALSVLYLSAGVLLFLKRKIVVEKLEPIISYILKKYREKKNEIFTMPRYARWLFIALLVFISAKGLWYIIYIPLQYDEVWTYNYYIGNSFWQSFLLPQNHIFFTAVAWFFHWLPVDPQISIRLPNLFAGLALTVIFFLFIKRNVSVKAALFSSYWLATCSPVVFYMLFARGYLFVLLFTVITLWVQLILLENKRIKLFGAVLLMAIVLGYWSNPVFMYPHATIGLTMICFLVFKKSRKQLWQNMLIHALSVFFVIILYLPTLLSSHIYDLMNVGIRHTFRPEFLWQTFYYNSWFIFGFNEGYYLLFLLIVLFIIFSLFQKRFNFLHGFVVMSFCVLFIYTFLQSLALAGFITIFISVSIAVMLSIILRGIELKTTLNKIIMIVMLAGTAAFNSYQAHHHHWLNWSVTYDQSAKNVAQLMLEKNINSCYLTVNYYKPHLEYYFKIKGKKLRLSLQDSVSQDFREFHSNEQEVVIIRNTKPTKLDLQEYQQFFKDETITAFIRKDIHID